MTTRNHLQPTAVASGIEAPPMHRPEPDRVRAALAKRSYATLATTSPAGWPHAAGVIYEFVDPVLYINTLRTSRKARNVAANPCVAVCVPIRRLPVGPPSALHFQGKAEVLDLDDPEIVGLIAKGRLRSITSHGELENAESCFLRITPGRRFITYGLGMSIPKLIGDPLNAGGVVDLEPIIARSGSKNDE